MDCSRRASTTPRRSAVVISATVRSCRGEKQTTRDVP